MRKSLIAFTAAALTLAASAHAEGRTIVINHWRPCATGIQHDKPSWDEVPSWTREKSIQRYFYGDPRLLANHGLCNAKFHRVVLCLPGWEESRDKEAGWFKVCDAFNQRLAH